MGSQPITTTHFSAFIEKQESKETAVLTLKDVIYFRIVCLTLMVLFLLKSIKQNQLFCNKGIIHVELSIPALDYVE